MPCIQQHCWSQRGQAAKDILRTRIGEQKLKQDDRFWPTSNRVEKIEQKATEENI